MFISAVHRTRILALVAAALLAAAAGADAAVAAGSCSGADVVAPSCFEGGDGNLAVDNAAGNRVDWATLPSPIPTQTDPGVTKPATDTVFDSANGGAKENDPGKWKLEVQAVNTKSDVLAAGAFRDLISSDIFLYSAFERSAGGDVNFSFELNRGRPNGQLLFNPNDAGADCSGTPAPLSCVPYRSAGDMLITYDGNAGNVTVRACTWKGDQFGETSNSAYGWYTLPGPLGQQKLGGTTSCTPLPASQALGNVNSVPLTNSSGGSKILPSFSDTLAAGNFGELSIDISQVLSTALAGSAPCFSFGGIWLHTRTSSSGGATMQDYVAPIPLKDAANCAIEVDKEVAVSAGDAAATPPAFPSAAYGDGTVADPSIADRGDGLFYALVVTNPSTNFSGAPITGVTVTDPGCSGLSTDATTPAAKINDDGDADLDQLGTGGNPEQWVWYCKRTLTSADGASYANTVQVDGSIGGKALSDTDTAQTWVRPQLTVVKRVSNDNGGTAGPADFTMNVTGANPTASAFPGDSSGKAVSLDPGAYRVGESGGPTGYSATVGTACDSANAGVGPLAYGDKRTCEIVNDDVAPRLTIVGVTDPSDPSAQFDYTTTGTSPALLGSAFALDGAGPGSSRTRAVAAGLLTVHQAGPTAASGAWDLTDLACTGDSAPNASVPGTLASGDVLVDLQPGEDVTCTFTNTKRANVTIAKATAPAGLDQDFGFQTSGATASDLGRAFTLNAATAPSIVRDVRPGTYTVTEDDPGRAGYRLTGLTCAESTGNGDTSTSSAAALASQRQATISAQPGEVISCTFTNTQLTPRSLLLKTGTEVAYHGDTLTYEFAVTNVGNSPLREVVVTDDRCSAVGAEPVRRVNDDGGSSLDPVGPDGVNPEQWIFTCSMTAPDHSDGEANPIVNTATVNAKDELGRPAPPASAQHRTRLLHPAVTLDKTGPASATAGTAVTYTLTAANTGDEAFAAPLVIVSDARCDAPPSLLSTNGDASPATFDPGDRWAYTCQVQTAATDTSVRNTGVVTAEDPNGRKVSATDSADTTLTAPIVVLPEKLLAANARLRGPVGCLSAKRAPRVVVTGRRIASVTYYVGGRKVKTLTRGVNGRFVLRLDTRRMGYGAHGVIAVVKFRPTSVLKTKTLRLRVIRCRPVVVPKFTG